MPRFMLGFLQFFLPGLILVGTYAVTGGATEGLIGVLGGGSSAITVLLLNVIARDGWDD